MPEGIRILFLHLYGANLSRARRNDPATACRDAINQLAALAGPAVALVYIYFCLVVWRQGLRHLYSLDLELIGLILPVTFGLVFFLKRAFRVYETMPDAALAYRSPRTVWVTNLCYFAVPIASAVLTGVLLHFVDPPA